MRGVKGTGAIVLSIAAILLLATLFAWAGSEGSHRVFEVPVFALCGASCFALNWLAFVPSLAARTERYYDLTGTPHLLTRVSGVPLLEARARTPVLWPRRPA